MRYIFLHLSIAILFFTSFSHAQEAGTKARLAFEHWYCGSLIIFMSNNDKSKLDRQKVKHRDTGLKYARAMLYELNSYGVQNQENWSKNAPYIWGYYLNYIPSEEFLIGRLYEATENSAYDDINNNPDGTFIVDADKRHNAAAREYDYRNCKILK